MTERSISYVRIIVMKGVCYRRLVAGGSRQRGQPLLEYETVPRQEEQIAPASLSWGIVIRNLRTIRIRRLQNSTH